MTAEDVNATLSTANNPWQTEWTSNYLERGDVALLPKTSELEEHYIKDFGAIPVASYGDNGRRFCLICDVEAKNIMCEFIE